jgi:hypothetical protein
LYRYKLWQKIYQNYKKIKVWLIIGFYGLFHTRAITPVIKSPISAVNGERGIEDGLF